MDAVMMKVQERYKFRMEEDSEDGVFRFCGRLINQAHHGVTITSPGVLDRVKAIFIEPLRRKQRGLPATPAEIAQLRSVVGSLSWYSRACRPDLAFQVNQLQAIQLKARVEDLMVANRLLSFALETQDRGVPSPRMLLTSYDATNEGHIVSHRSQWDLFWP